MDAVVVKEQARQDQRWESLVCQSVEAGLNGPPGCVPSLTREICELTPASLRECEDDFLEVVIMFAVTAHAEINRRSLQRIIELQAEDKARRGGEQ